ncbi:MAG: hypothetical protein KZQ83_06475 [gamma proteobacterium symbiont of Taylorina sp.]|nr:hypothetical protein [gamma proteobacterium symbiont of Taylorina sp.]
MIKAILLMYLILLSSVSLTAHAESDKEIEKLLTKTVYIQGGAYNHFSDDDDYKGDPLFISAEIIQSNQWLYGLGLFNNSFDQFSQYLYGGYIFKFDGALKNIHVKLTAGIIHGYKDEFEDKLPYNSSGYAPAIIPSVGWKKDKLGFDVILLGNAGLLFTLGYDVFEF